MASSPYFLARRGGETSAPLTESDIAALREAGTISEFHWIWKPGATGWEALEAAPAAPMAPPAAVAASAPTSVPAPATAARRSIQFDPSGIQALCHDFQQVVQGRVLEATDAGCRLQAAGNANDAPQLTLRARVVLQLLDSGTGRAMAVSATVRRAGRADGRWVYDLEWKGCPELIPTVAA